MGAAINPLGAILGGGGGGNASDQPNTMAAPQTINIDAAPQALGQNVGLPTTGSGSTPAAMPTGDQIAASGNQANNAVGQQAAFAQALAGQNALGNQNAAFNQQQNLNAGLAGVGADQTLRQAQTQGNNLYAGMNNQNGLGYQNQAMANMSGLQNQMAGSNNLGVQNNNLAHMQNTAGQLQGWANGTGPNPALNQLNQQTGNNIQQQAALMASQRGAGANAGLMARNAGMQGAGIQQQAAGQAATMQAQQQIAAMGQLQAQQGMLQGATGQNIGQLQGQQNMQGAQANQLVGQQMQQNRDTGNLALNTVNAQQAGNNAAASQAATQVAQQQAANNAATQGALGYQSNMLGAGESVNQGNVSIANNQNTNATALESNRQKQNAGLLSGALSGIGGALPALGGAFGGGSSGGGATTDFSGADGMGGGFAHGGMIHQYADGGAIQQNPMVIQPLAPQPSATPMDKAGMPESKVGKSLGGFGEGMQEGFKDPYASSSDAKGSSGMMSGVLGAGMKMFGGMGGGGGAPSTPTMTDSSQAPTDFSGADGMGNFAKGGKVPAMVSPGERYLPPKEVEKVKEGKKSPVKAGEKIPGKASVKGDSLKNDTVSKNLEEGGIVIPRSVMQSKDPAGEAHKFVTAILAKQSLKGKAK